MATWTTTAQLTTGTQVMTSGTHRLWFCGGAYASAKNVTVGSYQDATHVSDAGDAEVCTTNHVHNVKYLTSTTMSLDGAGSANLSTLTTANAPLKINFSDASSVATSNAKFYFYDGTTDATAMAGVTVQCAEAGVTSTWVAANGLGAALSLQDQSAATSHDFFVAASMTPTSTGAKTGKFKLSLTYV